MVAECPSRNCRDPFGQAGGMNPPAVSLRRLLSEAHHTRQGMEEEVLGDIRSG
ncbi:MAG: hypothetical protein OXC57_01685 [Rhodobacteraceae bacterium]|nr:hypothetical protein [Paracoccaceae bacterium]